MNESKLISANIIGHLIVNHANVHYAGDITKISDGEINILAQEALKYSRALDILNEQ